MYVQYPYRYRWSLQFLENEFSPFLSPALTQRMLGPHVIRFFKVHSQITIGNAVPIFLCYSANTSYFP